MNEYDAVSHPKHYTSHPSGIECIQVTEHMGFCLGNAVKYIWRADLKHDAIEDLRKARWYLDREIERRVAAPETFVAGDGSPADQEARDLKIGPYADERPWIQWAGGDLPVGPNVRVDILTRESKRLDHFPAYTWAWAHGTVQQPWDIVAYRVCKQ